MSNQPELSLQQVQHVATLARLKLSDDELASIAGDLRSILHHVDRLAEVDVSGVAPMSSPHSHCSRLHDDVPEPPVAQAAVLDQAPATEGAYIAVPKVLDGGGAA